MLPGTVRQLHFNSTGDPNVDCIEIEHNDFVGECDLLPSFLQWFSDECRIADEILLPGVSASISLRRDGLLHAARCAPAFANRELRSVKNGTGIAAGFGRNTRQRLNKSFREFERAGSLRIEEAQDAPTALAYFEALKLFHIRHWNGKAKQHAFRRRYFEAFHRELIGNSFASGNVQLLKISAGSTVAGYLYNFRHGNCTYAYQSGFDYTDPGLRPGYVSHALAMDRSALAGGEEYDFLAGDNRLKRDFASQEYLMSWHRFSRRRPRMRLEATIRAALRR
ncbi:MAG TPA: GNAT family N-acetyltransferase [Rhizomicrobium sp.]|jgi:hypothetical protein|nr:GNAT family N-acetyltransferase [Rhizomicrobium sp.]